MIDLDIVIVNWNAGKQIIDCLNTLLVACQGSVLFKLSICVIVDNGSTDGSSDDLETLPLPVTLIRNTRNMGFGYASNQGSIIGRSKYILFLNPDVRLAPDNLIKTIMFMEEAQNERFGAIGIQFIVGGEIQRTTARIPTRASFFYQMLGLDHLWPKRFPPLLMTDWDHKKSMDLYHVPGAFLLVRRKVFEDLHGFDERFFMYYEDLDLSLRMRQAGWKIYYLATTQAFHQGGGTTDQVKAGRHFYLLCSRVHYVAKHFGYWTAIGIVITSLLVEFWVRLGWSVGSLSGQNMIDTLRAYGMFVRALPTLLRDIKDEKE
jgi:N-acetylglucosaminyl-diphospho-decaprenol L-rhamnosyltransferase